MKIERAEGLAWRRIGSETFVVDLRAKVMYGLNPAGGMVWQAIVDGDDLGVVTRRLAMSDGGSVEQTLVEGAVADFVVQLADLDLLREPFEQCAADGRRPQEVEGFEAPAILWSEELVAYAQVHSCLFDNHLNCPAGPAT